MNNNIIRLLFPLSIFSLITLILPLSCMAFSSSSTTTTKTTITPIRIHDDQFFKQQYGRRWVKNSRTTTTTKANFRKFSSSSIVTMMMSSSNKEELLENTTNNSDTILKVLKGITEVLKNSFSNLTSGYVKGFIAGNVWRILSFGRGGNNAFMWGVNFGFFSALFEATNGFSQMLLQSSSSSEDDDDKKEKRFVAVTIWSAVIRNGIMAIYFNRMRGALTIMMNAAIYSILTYFSVSRNRDNIAANMNGGMNLNDLFGGAGGFGGNNMMNNPFNTYGVGGGGGGGFDQASMLKILEMVQQQQQGGGGGIGMSSTNQQQEEKDQNKPKESNEKASSSSSSKPTEFLDVEWSDNNTIDETEETEKE